MCLFSGWWKVIWLRPHSHSLWRACSSNATYSGSGWKGESAFLGKLLLCAFVWCLCSYQAAKICVFLQSANLWLFYVFLQAVKNCLCFPAKKQPQEHCSKYCFQNPEFWWDKQILMWTIYYNALWKWFVWLSDPVSGTFIHKYWWNSCYRFTGLDVTNFAFKIVSWCSCSFWWPWPLCKVTVGQHKRKFSVELSQHLRK